MDKITRIHIAKVPYEIGIGAQEELQRYFSDIHAQLDADLADETMTDIEVRVTEILGERNIKRNDVITSTDVDAIKEQLGLPEQFDDGNKKSRNKKNSAETKKLLRDTDNSLVGGVASGLGAYLNIDPVFIRIAFIVLTFFWAFGIVLYLLLWFMVPAAKTSSDKLLMRGEPVTAAALQRYRDTAQRTILDLRLRRIFQIGLRVFKIIFTVGALIFILGLLIFIGLVSTTLYTPPLHSIYTGYHLNYLLLSLFWLFNVVLIGLVIVVLLHLWKKGKASLKIPFFSLVGIMVITIAGLAVTTPFIVSHYRNIYGGNRLALAIPVIQKGDVKPTSLSLSADNKLDVDYEVTSNPIHATYQSYPGMKRANITVTNENGAIAINANNLDNVIPDCVLDWCKNIYLPVHMTLYGPALEKFTVNRGASLNVSNLNQNNITLNAQNYSNITIEDSYGNEIDINADSWSRISTFNTTAQTANIDEDGNSYVYSPFSDNLNATVPSVCDQGLLEVSQPPISFQVNKHRFSPMNLDQNNCVIVDQP